MIDMNYFQVALIWCKRKRPRKYRFTFDSFAQLTPNSFQLGTSFCWYVKPHGLTPESHYHLKPRIDTSRLWDLLLTLLVRSVLSLYITFR
jgi:hypothetical protein